MMYYLVNSKTGRVLERHTTRAAAEHAVKLVNDHNAHWGHPTRYHVEERP